MSKSMLLFIPIFIAANCGFTILAEDKDAGQAKNVSRPAAIDFTIRSVADGNWSDPKTWKPARQPKDGDRVLVTRKTRVIYDVQSKAKIRLVQVVGTLSFALLCTS